MGGIRLFLMFASIIFLCNFIHVSNARSYHGEGKFLRCTLRQCRTVAMLPHYSPTASSPAAAVAISLGACTAAGLASERTAVGSRLTGALCSFLFAASASNAGILPGEHRVFDFCWGTVLPASLAVTVLSGQSAGRRGAADDGYGYASGDASTGTAVAARTNRRNGAGVGLAFGIGALGSIAGAALGFAVATHSPWAALRLPSRRVAAQCAAALAATYVGGSANLFVVARETGLDSDAATLGAMAASDVALMGAYFAVLLSSSKSAYLRRVFGGAGSGLKKEGGEERSMGMSSDRTYSPAHCRDLPDRAKRCMRSAATATCLLALSAVLLQVSEFLAARVSASFSSTLPGLSTALLTGLSSLAATALRCTEACWSKRREECTSHQVRRRASIAPVLSPVNFPSWHRETVGPQLSSLMLYTFFAAVGASARIDTLTSAGPAVLAFTAITLVVHVTVLSFGAAAANRLKKSLSTSSHRVELSAGRTRNQEDTPQGAEKAALGGGSSSSSSNDAIELDEILVASNANIGGAATAASFAGLIGRPDLVAPAAAWGTVGYGIATFLGCRLYSMLL